MNLVYSITAQSNNRKFPVGYTTAYRFGFNGKEKDNETYGEGNEYDFGERIFDPRLARWHKIDALFMFYSGTSPYSYALNNPISNSDYDGAFVIDQSKPGAAQLRMFVAAAKKTLECPDIRAAFREHSGMSDQQIDEMFTEGKGPILTMGQLPQNTKDQIKTLAEFQGVGEATLDEMAGRTDAEKAAMKKDVIVFEERYWNDKLEAYWNMDYMKAHHAFYMAIILLHELVHYGDLRTDGLKANSEVIKKFASEPASGSPYWTYTGLQDGIYDKNTTSNSYPPYGIEPGLFFEFSLLGGHISPDNSKAFLKDFGKGLKEMLNDFVKDQKIQKSKDCTLKSRDVCCFIAGTKISLANGGLKNIEHVMIGDTIRTVDLQTMSLRNHVVKRLGTPKHKELIKIYLSDGTTIISTYDHSYYTKDLKWKSYKPELTKDRYGIDAYKLIKGDFLIKIGKDFKLKTVKVLSLVELKSVEQQTYTIYTDSEDHNYFANGILVHDDGK